jgi:hypothetical protein
MKLKVAGEEVQVFAKNQIYSHKKLKNNIKGIDK